MPGGEDEAAAGVDRIRDRVRDLNSKHVNGDADGLAGRA
jgi:hypothetical protein